MLPKNRIDKLTWLILNNVISPFGLRMRNDELVYSYKLPPDGCKNIYKTDRTLKGGNTYFIPLTKDFNEVFRFVNLDKERYDKGFEDWIQYTSFLLENCSYLTRVVINSLQHGIETDSMKSDMELLADLKKFLLYVRLSHQELIKDNKMFPAMLYYNIKEDIVRNFFYTEELEERIKSIKKRELFKNELANKFNAKKITAWLPELKKDTELLNMFGRTFINYITEGKLGTFPDYLVDSEESEIRREALLFYDYMFLESTEYKLYVIEGPNNEHVVM